MDESNSPAQTTSPTGSNKNVLYVGIGVVVLLVLLAGVAFAFKVQIQGMVAPVEGPVEENVEVQQGDESTAGTEESTEGTTMNGEESTGGATVAAVVEVDYTASGFTPTEVTIKKGGTVKFVDKSGNPMDVASAPHPVHTDYTGFDQGKSSASGMNEYSFTFDKVGTWGYHNPENPVHRGTVVVTE